MVGGRSYPNESRRAFPSTAGRQFPVFGSSEPAIKDPSFASVTLLLGMNGADAATETSDESTLTHTISFTATAQLDTAQKKFGSASLLLDGNSDIITAPDHAGFSFPTEDFTIELFMNMPVVQAGMLISKYSSNPTTAEWYMFYNGTNLSALMYYGTGVSSNISFGGALSIAANSFHHVALSRTGNTFWLYGNGTVVASHAETRTLKNSTELLTIGARNHPSPIYFDGWIDEVRITKGVDRYGGNSYVVPTQEFPRS